MFKIAKQFHFSASHQLKNLPEDHPCGRLHGHNYIVELILEGSLNDKGFVTDYGDLGSFKRYLDERLDHRHLEDVVDFQTSAENLSKHLYGVAVELFGDIVYGCRVRETPKTWAEYHPD